MYVHSASWQCQVCVGKHTAHKSPPLSTFSGKRCPPVAYIPSISSTLGTQVCAGILQNQFLFKIGPSPLISKFAQLINAHIDTHSFYMLDVFLSLINIYSCPNFGRKTLPYETNLELSVPKSPDCSQLCNWMQSVITTVTPFPWSPVSGKIKTYTRLPYGANFGNCQLAASVMCSENGFRPN